MDYTDFNMTYEQYVAVAKKFAPAFDAELKSTGCPACTSKTAGLVSSHAPYPLTIVNECCPGLEPAICERFQKMMEAESARLGTSQIFQPGD